MVIDGRAIARSMLGDLKRRAKPRGKLVAVLAGENTASEKFLREKARVAHELGILFEVKKVKDEPGLRRIIARLNKDSSVRGIVLQLPLPSGFATDAAITSIAPQKDVDVLRGESHLLPPAAGTVKTILDYLGSDFRNMRAVVVGRGLLVGHPVAAWLKPRVAELDQFHRTHFDKKRLKAADLVISGVGKPGLIAGREIKRGAILIDFGYGVKVGIVSGDFDFETCAPKAGAITPTPGGTGPILIAELFKNFFAL